MRSKWTDLKNGVEHDHWNENRSTKEQYPNYRYLSIIAGVRTKKTEVRPDSPRPAYITWSKGAEDPLVILFPCVAWHATYGSRGFWHCIAVDAFHRWFCHYFAAHFWVALSKFRFAKGCLLDRNWTIWPFRGFTGCDQLLSERRCWSVDAPYSHSALRTKEKTR